MHFTAVFQPVALMAMLPILGCMAVPIAEPEVEFNTTVFPLVERYTVGPTTSNSPILRNIMLEAHNKVRAYYNAPALTWDPQLATFAQQYANTCPSGHSGGPYGENLYAIYPAASVQNWYKTSQDGIGAWNAEVSNYDFNNPGFSLNTGHFTQVIWKSSQTLGCAWSTVSCEDGWGHLYCEYYPPGNVVGEFPANTLPH